MYKNDVDLLQCPYCETPFRVGDVWESSRADIRYGSIWCECDEFPIVEGILYLFRPMNRTILETLRNGKFVEAFLLLSTQKRLFQPSRIWMKWGIKLIGQQRNVLELTRKIGREKAVWFLQWVMPRNLLEYYFDRDKWMDSLALAFPLGVLLATEPKQKKKIIWMDVGAGLLNYYGELQLAWPNSVIVSEDANFLNLFLSRAFYPGKHVNRICSDANFLHVVKPKTLDVLTFIDSLHCLNGTTSVLKSILEDGWLKPTSMLFVSGIPEHIYLDKSWGLFPINRKQVKKAFRALRAPTFLDNKSLAAGMSAGVVDVKKVQQQLNNKSFRYSFFWSKKVKLPAKITMEFLPAELIAKAVRVWEMPKKTWQNRAY